MQSPSADQIMAIAKRWRSIYPSYIDSSLKMSQGRRLGLQYCVQSPTLQEISDALSKLQLQHLVEGHKFYARDILKAGRVKVRLVTDEGKVINPEIKNKWALLKKVAAHIKAIPKRKIEKPTYQFEQEEAPQPTKDKKHKKKK